MKRLMLAAFISLGAGCGGGDGGYDSADGDVNGDAGATLDDDAGRDVAPLEVGPGVVCADPDRPGEVRARPCVSACGEGTERCLDGRWQACSARQPTPEDCHTALDDDCDGVANEDCGECAPGATRRCPAAPPDIGACRGGTQTCGADRMWGMCVGEQRPAEEQCNGVDDDCDGAADEDLVRSCASTCGAGVQRCAAGGWGACSARPPEPEVCNNVDDDCDGSVDEGVTRACRNACGTAGTEFCRGGSWASCTAPPPPPEACDLRDNNCDGRVDEGLTAPFTIYNHCVRSRIFIAFGGCNACRTTCTGYWIEPNTNRPFEFMQNTTYYFSAFARTPRGDVCLDRSWPDGGYAGEVTRYDNGDCRPDSHAYRCVGWE